MVEAGGPLWWTPDVAERIVALRCLGAYRGPTRRRDRRRRAGAAERLLPRVEQHAPRAGPRDDHRRPARGQPHRDHRRLLRAHHLRRRPRAPPCASSSRSGCSPSRASATASPKSRRCARPGVTQADIDTLIGRRLLRREDAGTKGGPPRADARRAGRGRARQAATVAACASRRRVRWPSAVSSKSAHATRPKRPTPASNSGASSRRRTRWPTRSAKPPSWRRRWRASSAVRGDARSRGCRRCFWPRRRSRGSRGVKRSGPAGPRRQPTGRSRQPTSHGSRAASHGHSPTWLVPCEPTPIR